MEPSLEALPTVEAVKAERGKRHLRRFVELAWPYVEPEQPFVPGWHIDEICDALEAVTYGDIPQLIINVPPGCMKSLLVSVFWPSWEWARDPSLRYLAASYSAHLSIRDNLRLRNIVSSPWYQAHYALRLSGDQRAKELFRTTAGGWRFATSTSGGGTGEHPDRIIIDDPATAEESRSEAERLRVKEWYDGTIAIRGKARDRRIVIIAQRLHEDDLPGYLLTKGGWHHICLPMRFEAGRKDPRDHRLTEGELLWPGLFPEEKVLEIERDLGSYKTSGQLQQRPSPAKGGRIKRAWWGRFIEPPAEPLWDLCLMSMDLSVESTDSSDPIAWLLMVLARGQVLILDGLSDRMDTPDVLALIGSKARLWPQATLKLIENKAAGPHVIQLLRTKVPGVVPWPQKGVAHPSKEQRVWACEPFIEAGNVLVPAPSSRFYGLWVDQLIDQCAAFPNAAHDDWVDALTQGLLHVYPSAWGRVDKDWQEAREAGSATSVAELQRQLRQKEIARIKAQIEKRARARGRGAQGL